MTQRVMRSGATPMTGPFKASDGAASAPSVTFNSAPGTGAYKTANGVGVAVNGSQVAEFTANGLTKGVRFIGELIPWTGSTAPPLCILPNGQSVLRASYPDLWAFAQAEIAAGNTFYNNGNGTTTFGICDLRGCTLACPDNMGGGDRALLGGGALAPVRFSIGGTGGESQHSLSLGEAPTGITSSGGGVACSGTISGTIDSGSTILGGGTGIAGGPGNQSSGNSHVSGTFSGNTAGLNVTSNNTGGTGHNNIQPTVLCYYALYAGA